MNSLLIILSVCVVVISVTDMASANNPLANGEQVDPETAELLERYIKAHRISAMGYLGGLPWFSNQQKRNSELINSILGLPKVMNDAGRRK
ncbi:Pigment-dispersing hormone peptide [Orchesella cincta]|uniref:Pigment-dispersing hormone peptide n=1 Tax=Orchesella cincta TaxID=48709 RepID=A0A1D2M1P2_ORCCI|nr:Pigment-dispersing hormone peptide [Orchesella cincta]